MSAACECRHCGINRIVKSLAGPTRHIFPLMVDENQRGPSINLKGIPDFTLSVIDHRVADLVSGQSLADALGGLFVVKFGAVNSDHNEFLGILGLQLCQVWQCVDAIDATKCPEIEKDNLAP